MSIATLQLQSQAVTNLLEHIDKCEQAVARLSDAWTQLERDYDDVMEQVNSADAESSSSDAMTKVLKDAKAKWINLAQDASKIKKSLLSPSR